MKEKTLHLLWTGDIGGIETLCKDIAKYSSQANQFCFVHSGGVLYEEMHSSGYRVSYLGYSNKNFFNLFAFLCRKVSSDAVKSIVIHHDAPLLWLTAALVKQRFHNTSLFVYAHCNYNSFIGNNTHKRTAFRYVLKHATAVISISHSVKNSILAYENLPEGKINVIYNGIDCNTYHFPVRGSCSNPLKLLYVGRLIEEKGIQVLLHALTLLQEGVTVQCDIVGDGPYRQQLESLCDQLHLRELVYFHGQRRNVVDYYHAADVFVHPAIWEEGFGITLVEAMAAGLPCIAFDRGAVSEIITEGTGYTVIQTSAKALAEKISQVFSESQTESFLTVRKNAIARANCFSIQKMVYELDSLTGSIK